MTHVEIDLTFNQATLADSVTKTTSHIRNFKHVLHYTCYRLAFGNFLVTCTMLRWLNSVSNYQSHMSNVV